MHETIDPLLRSAVDEQAKKREGTFAKQNPRSRCYVQEAHETIKQDRYAHRFRKAKQHQPKPTLLFLSRTYTSFTQLAGTTPLPARLSTSHHPSP